MDYSSHRDSANAGLSAQAMAAGRNLLVAALGGRGDAPTPGGVAEVSQPSGADATGLNLKILREAAEAFVAATSTYRLASAQP
jgi:hypothetical protein